MNKRHDDAIRLMAFRVGIRFSMPEMVECREKSRGLDGEEQTKEHNRREAARTVGDRSRVRMLQSVCSLLAARTGCNEI
ncbi:MAG: hypothetical protein AB7O66_05135 [Limisphaerales bacterium]